MTGLGDREKALENKYALDKEQEFKAIARRNKLLGLWAAAELNYDESKAAEYAKEVVIADFEEPGDEDVFRKVQADFVSAGLAGREDEIRKQMSALINVAKEQILSEM